MAAVTYSADLGPSIIVKYGPVIFYTIIQIISIIAAYAIYGGTVTTWSVIWTLFWLAILFVLCFFNHYYIAWFLIFLPLIVMLIIYLAALII